MRRPTDSGQDIAMSALLEVVVWNIDDARRAADGGADRLMLVGELRGQGISPAPDDLADVLSAVAIPVRPLLRLREGYRTDGGEAVRLQGLLANYLELGVDGVVLGFLDGYARVDVEVVQALTERGDFAWTFDRAIDRCLDTDQAWQTLQSFPGLDGVQTGGSARGLSAGLDDLIARAAAHPEQAGLMIAGGGLRGDQIPWLLRAGVSQFQIGPQARPYGQPLADVDSSLVHGWRVLLDRN